MFQEGVLVCLIVGFPYVGFAGVYRPDWCKKGLVLGGYVSVGFFGSDRFTCAFDYVTCSKEFVC